MHSTSPENRKKLPFQSTMPMSEAAMIRLNVGIGLDIPTGVFLPGRYGEYNLNGGMGVVHGISGKGNSWKTTILEFMMHRAYSRVTGFNMESDISTHDTEENKDASRIEFLYQKFPELSDRNLFDEGIYRITGKSAQLGDKWYAELKEFLEKKEKNKKDIMVETPFLTANKRDLVKIMQPTFSLIDSFSEFETSDIAKIMDENELGESGGNTIYMRQNLAKNRLLMEYPRLGMGNQHYLGMATHYGKEIQMASGPYAPPPEKKIPGMKPGEMIKGVPNKYYYLVMWQALSISGTKLVTKEKTVDYPKDSNDKMVGDTDLWEIPLETVRSKFGRSSWTTSVICSQDDGVLPSLTEFHMLRKSRFGLVGNDMNYVNAFMPDEKLSRSVIRRKLDASAALRRATNIASELYQMSIYHVSLKDAMMDPEEIYAKIKEKGYNWDMILNKTRGWWKPFNDVHPLLPLSSLDILNMAKGRYHPYWLEDDKQTIKSQFITPGHYEFN